MKNQKFGHYYLTNGRSKYSVHAISLEVAIDRLKKGIKGGSEMRWIEYKKSPWAK